MSRNRSELAGGKQGFRRDLVISLRSGRVSDTAPESRHAHPGNCPGNKQDGRMVPFWANLLSHFRLSASRFVQETQAKSGSMRTQICNFATKTAPAGLIRCVCS
jgi:hypothetical protein